MSKRFMPYNPDQAFLLPPSVKDVLGEDHLAFFVHRVGGGWIWRSSPAPMGKKAEPCTHRS